MKFFSNIFLHLFVAATVIGAAVGCHEEHIRSVITYPVTGLAVGLGIGVIIRFVMMLD